MKPQKERMGSDFPLTPAMFQVLLSLADREKHDTGTDHVKSLRRNMISYFGTVKNILGLVFEGSFWPPSRSRLCIEGMKG